MTAYWNFLTNSWEAEKSHSHSHVAPHITGEPRLGEGEVLWHYGDWQARSPMGHRILCSGTQPLVEPQIQCICSRATAKLTMKVVKIWQDYDRYWIIFHLLHVSLPLSAFGSDVGSELSHIVDFSAVLQRWNTSLVNIYDCIQSAIVPSLLWQSDIHLPSEWERGGRVLKQPASLDKYVFLLLINNLTSISIIQEVDTPPMSRKSCLTKICMLVPICQTHLSNVEDRKSVV